ncbi:MAG: hypothetical protein KF777_16085 [Planctomycetaceae bacterium]|nr:hypothetical protein [Planctomycetaceae bacterium]
MSGAASPILGRSLVWLLAGLVMGFIALISAQELQADEDDRPTIRSFYVRAVTGPLRGKSVCYVCRHGDRPVVIVLMREITPGSRALLKELNQLVDENRAEGLKAFAVLVSANSVQAAADLQTVGFVDRLELPLTTAGEAITSAEALDFPASERVGVILYRDQAILGRHEFGTSDCGPADRAAVIADVRSMIGGEKPGGP